MVKQFCVAILLLLSTCSLVRAAKCRAVSLEGGGSHGAYEAGVLRQFVESLPAADVTWDVVTGISTGALNTFGVAQFATGDEQAMTEYLEGIWLNITGSSSVYVDWPGGIVNGLVTKPSIYDTSPLRKTLNDFNKYGIQRNFVVGATDLNVGTFVNFDDSVGNADFTTVVMASAAPPFFFPPIVFRDTPYADGGCVLNLDVFSGIERCLEVASQRDVIVDMVYDNYNSSLPLDSEFHTLDVLFRVKHIKSIDSATWYTYNAHVAYPEVTFRYTIYPSKAMPGGYVPLDFSHSVLVAELAEGKADAKKAIERGENGREVIIENYRRMRSNIFYATD